MTYLMQKFFQSQKILSYSFFAQQAVKKVLKALFIVIAKEDPPKILTVTELYRVLKNKSKFSFPEEIENQLYFLNKYYTVSRYPDAANGLPSESVDGVEVGRALKLAKDVFNYGRRYFEQDQEDI